MPTDLGEVHGPVDYILLQFASDADTSAVGAAMLNVIESGTVRLYDMLIIRKSADGSFSSVAASDLSDHGANGFAALSGARSGLLGESDLNQAAAIMDPGTSAALLVYENTWAVPFVAAALDAGVEPIASARIPATEVMEALEELEAADAAN